MGAQQSAPAAVSAPAPAPATAPAESTTPSAGALPPSSSTSSSSSSSSLPPLQEVVMANADRLIVAIHGHYYDLTDFAYEHPGGREVLEECAGTDATLPFDMAFHHEDVKEQMLQYRMTFDTPSVPAAVSTPSVPAVTITSTTSTTTPILILYGSLQGRGKRFAERTAERLSSLVLTCTNNNNNNNNNNNSSSISQTRLTPTLKAMNDMDPEDLHHHPYVLLFISTYTDGTPPDNAKFFFNWIEEASVDFRVGDSFLSSTKYAVFGCGNSLYEENFNVIAKKLSSYVDVMGAQPLCADGVADESVSRTKAGTMEDDFIEWLHDQLVPGIREAIEHADRFAARMQARKEERHRAEQAQKEAEEREAEEEEERELRAQERQQSGEIDGEKVVDVEELGKVMMQSKAKQAAGKSSAAEAVGAPRAMLTDQLRAALSKQGYKLIGTHSGVKLCRWTKGMMRGRGGCYKHTMYGIQSFQCMEMTPSLACANKCIFCWRHGTNPVGKDWRWQIDEPAAILEQAMQHHRRMINVLRGVPGVRPERLAEAQRIRHCALSLVGEPIMYPHINEFLRLLHNEGISSFLVTNAQFPDRVAQLEPVCQLYLSIDAATQDALKAVDRPLFSDFWPRFLDCLQALRQKRQRTVYRLTLVKSHNMTDVAEYAKLVRIGEPTFIEIKGVTFCGDTSAANQLTMSNVPFHDEVRAFGEALCAYLGDDQYAMACEHEHSCCILIASTKLRKRGVASHEAAPASVSSSLPVDASTAFYGSADSSSSSSSSSLPSSSSSNAAAVATSRDRWYTWIDYDKFNTLMREYYASNGEKTFGVEDYWAETPAWAVYNAPEAGFDPAEERVRNKSKRTLEEVRVERAREAAEKEKSVAV